MTASTPAPASPFLFRGRPRALALLGLPLALALALPAQAWGPLGHRLVASLAEPGLDPQARATVARLLQGEAEPTLAGIANWADDLRGNDPELGKRSARWHYVNIADPDCAFDAARDCPGDDCVVAALEAQAAILADPARSDAERRQALKFVVHFTGDVHQPLHAGRGADRGGNDYQVNWRGKGSNMHSLWDSGLLNSKGLDEGQWLARLRAQPLPPASPLPADAPRLWAEQSCRVVNAPGFYPSGHVIDQAYADRHLPIVERQLRLAGARLAATLNAALGGS
ncbi:S1/P1 nuclease [Pseudoxanthomonas koreensis]|uniref:S1/P1 nuclease n=1 Tax=Pseudoxanthomonas koreensis TaxID=266061 RepID=UPI001390BA55|nr:S1/P1 nuclease [Pseudoxanthomonas koreensis]KAF1689293.1 endonuclease [Pseudoxanthomonas koreensis]